jgi:hypothetical protein
MKFLNVILIVVATKALEAAQKEVVEKHPKFFHMNFESALKRHYLDNHEGDESLEVFRSNAIAIAKVAINAVSAFVPILHDDGGVILCGFPYSPEQLLFFQHGIIDRCPSVRISAYVGPEVSEDMYATLLESVQEVRRLELQVA